MKGQEHNPWMTGERCWFLNPLLRRENPDEQTRWVTTQLSAPLTFRSSPLFGLLRPPKLWRKKIHGEPRAKTVGDVLTFFSLRRRLLKAGMRRNRCVPLQIAKGSSTWGDNVIKPATSLLIETTEVEGGEKSFAFILISPVELFPVWVGKKSLGSSSCCNHYASHWRWWEPWSNIFQGHQVGRKQVELHD